MLTADTKNSSSNKFFMWIFHSVSDGSLSVNKRSSLVHRVKEGFVLVSPAIFQEYDPNHWRKVQKHVVRAKAHISINGKSSFSSYALIDNPHKGVTGLLIPNDKAFEYLSDDAAEIGLNHHLVPSPRQNGHKPHRKDHQIENPLISHRDSSMDESELAEVLKIVLTAFDGMSIEEIEKVLVNVRASIRKDVRVCIPEKNYEFRDIHPSKNGILS